MASPITKLLILDFEANCTDDNSRDHEICEFPCVLIDSTTGESLAEFRTYVKGVRIPRISSFINQLTGITDTDIATGVPWAYAVKLFDEWCQTHKVHSGNTVVVTCGDWDLKTMYPRQLGITKTHQLIPQRVKQLFSKWTNVKIVYANHQGYTRLYGMDTMLQDAGLTLDGRHHCGIDDCRNIAKICKYLIKAGKSEELQAGDRYIQ
jgi:inhibitor of KinA sporulation pathway (predicted exonuclease)